MLFSYFWIPNSKEKMITRMKALYMFSRKVGDPDDEHVSKQIHKLFLIRIHLIQAKNALDLRNLLNRSSAKSRQGTQCKV